jgi:HPt (histidine-containing phosphotransfer) domain-containing protein
MLFQEPEAGCDAYVTKPVDPEELMALLVSELERRGLGGGESDLLDVGPLISEMQDDDDFRPLLERYLHGLPVKLVNIEASHRERDADRLGEALHNLAGSAASYGFPSLSSSARECEEMVRDNCEWELLTEPVGRIIGFLRRAAPGAVVGGD